ncbi:hypothetical protein [Ulvibacter litoralis]|uniref:Uncharacterized protein n=1 Tax=Ulvibacter litoralis TaxID=227084 RepID=A0A1G7GYI6_9FLAO|nr:hypothetical protein [Ulvibacter litoralis]GHC59633.1 hypothetical protein GCM10008083_25670 [Ulvibacter litoralis]SDE93228.1 hypothetical protein SAMN05421855_103403 [Ulvibacter litoralis]
MQLDGLIHTFPKHVKMFIAAFVVVLSIGYITGLLFVGETDSTTPNGIEENYRGNEADEAATVMKFEKGEREMLTILHTHILSISFIFFLLGGLVSITSLPKKLKSFLMIEPFFSILLTFGGIYFMWKGISWMKYVVMISGMVMTTVYILSAGLVLFQLLKRK